MTGQGTLVWGTTTRLEIGSTLKHAHEHRKVKRSGGWTGAEGRRRAGQAGLESHCLGSRIEKSPCLPHIIFSKDQGSFKRKDAMEVSTKTP